MRRRDRREFANRTLARTARSVHAVQAPRRSTGSFGRSGADDPPIGSGVWARQTLERRDGRYEVRGRFGDRLVDETETRFGPKRGRRDCCLSRARSHWADIEHHRLESPRSTRVRQHASERRCRSTAVGENLVSCSGRASGRRGVCHTPSSTAPGPVARGAFSFTPRRPTQTPGVLESSCP